MTRRGAGVWAKSTSSIAGVMGVVVAVNLVLTYFAFSSSTGLVTKHPFDEGNGYNAILDAGARQDALGWKDKIAFAASGPARGEVAVTIADRDGKPVAGLSVIAHIDRPVEPVPIVTLPLHETSTGRYAAAAQFDRPGQWEVRIVARRGDALYEANERILVK